MRTYGPDIYFEREPDMAALAAASEAAFGAPARAVVITQLLSDAAYKALANPAVEVLWQRETDDQPGEFPAHYLLQTPDTIHQRSHSLSILASTIRIPFVTEARAEDAGDVCIFWPDGTMHLVDVEMIYDNDYAIELTRRDRLELEKNRSVTAEALAS